MVFLKMKFFIFITFVQTFSCFTGKSLIYEFFALFERLNRFNQSEVELKASIRKNFDIKLLKILT